MRLSRKLLALLFVSGFAGPLLEAPANAQLVEQRLTPWLCEFFSNPSAEALNRFPAYGLGPLQQKTTPRTDRKGVPVETFIATAHSDTVKLTFGYSTRPAPDGSKRTYGYDLKIESDGSPIWPDRQAATNALSRVGKVRYDGDLDQVVAESGYDREGQWYDWTVTFDTEFQTFDAQWGRPDDAHYGRGFCE